jgi:uncharacterized protein YehS (DUF1456 family)
MTNNDVLRRLRYALKLNDKKLMLFFRIFHVEMTQYKIDHFLIKEEDSGYLDLYDDHLAAVLDGLIIYYRGLQDGKVPEPWKKGDEINNNEILRKLKIALSLTDEMMIDMLAKADFNISKPELSSFFRSVDHRNYKECMNQFLRAFITGLTVHYRQENNELPEKVAFVLPKDHFEKGAKKKDNRYDKAKKQAPKGVVYKNPNAPKKKKTANTLSLKK